MLQKCPYLPPNPPGDEDLVQVGYSAFNCYSAEGLYYTLCLQRRMITVYGVSLSILSVDVWQNLDREV